MTRNIKENIIFYTFDVLSELGIRHGFSTKFGGVSIDKYAEMNLSFLNGDDKSSVLKNYQLISDAIGFSHENIVMCSQTHGINVEIVKKEHRGSGITRKNLFMNTDGLMTNEKDVVLTTLYADCVPLFFYDKSKNIVALSHAGWKGTLNEIGGETIKKMKAAFNSSPNDIIACIGPSIGVCCFEVDLPVAEMFSKKDYFKQFIFPDKTRKDKFHIDLQKVNQESFIRNGLKEKNIFNSGICTKCNSGTFHSHRAHGLERGSMAGFITL